MMTRILAALLVLLLSPSLQAEEVNFFSFEKGGYDRARVKAAQEGKLLFMDFYAKWCTPCKWMDETTFSDERIINKLNEDFVALKIDIDDMEGFELKSRFDIRYLPTILIFNTEGKIVERVEETLSPSKMAEILDRYNATMQQHVQKHQFNTSPYESITSTNVNNATLEANSNLSQDEMKVLSTSEYRNYFNNQETSYQMQMGVFQNYDGAFKKSNELRDIFAEEVSILEDSRSGSTMYKVVMGEFKSLSEAESFRKILKDKYNLDSILY